MRATLHNDAAIDDGHLVRSLDRGEAVGDDHNGAAGLHALQRLLHQRLALCVQRARRLHTIPALGSHIDCWPGGGGQKAQQPCVAGTDVND